jgi:hypothetical protein
VDIQQHRTLVEDLWATFADLVEVLTFTWSDFDYPNQEEYDELANELQILGCSFVDKYRAFKPTRKALYMHYITTHIPKQVRRVGPLGPFSGTSIEAGHKKVCLFVYLFICLFVYLFIYLFIYLLAEAPDDQEYQLPCIRWEVNQGRLAGAGKVCLFLYSLFVYLFMSLFLYVFV